MGQVVVARGFGGPEQLAVIDEVLVAPGPGEVALEVRAAGVNPYDAKAYGGAYGRDESQLPMRLGAEAAGVVTAVGGDVDGVEVGDEVIAFPVSGAYASDIVVSAAALTPKPAALGWEAAAGLMLTGATATHTLQATSVGAGDVVLVHGAAGGVGQMAVQLARQRGARVIGTASARNHDLLRELGAEPVEYGAGLAGRVAAFTPRVDAAIDTVGTDEALAVSLAVVADHRRIATIANFTPTAPVKVLGSGPGGDPGTDIRDAARAGLARLAGQGRLHVRVDRIFALADVADAHRYQMGGHPAGKVILVP